ncbi:MAG TPA: hypothetical protein VF691_14410 [Cytophagaceae bacterium]|jgi:hypothetical protein
MAGCGYVCPACEGKEVDEEGKPCKWCQPDVPKEDKKVSDQDLQQWIEDVHEGPCCSD